MAVMKTYKDSELLGLYKSERSMQALGTLYLRYSELVFGVCLKYLKDETKATDGSMQVFEKISKKLLTHNVENFKSWLHVLTKNHCLEILRKKKKEKTDFFSNEVMQKMDLKHHDKEFELVNEIEMLNSCLEELSEHQKYCINSFYLEDKTYKDISEDLGISLGSVRSQIQNGRRNLKNCMTQKLNKIGDGR